MCMGMSTPDIPEPIQYQTSQEPVFRDGNIAPSKRRGRRATIIAPVGAASMSDAMQPSRTVLGG